MSYGAGELRAGRPEGAVRGKDPPPAPYTYSPWAWSVACAASSARSARRRARLRRYAIGLNLVTFGLPASVLAAVVVLT